MSRLITHAAPPFRPPTRWTSRCGKHRRREPRKFSVRATDGCMVMCSRVIKPKVAVFPRDFTPMLLSETPGPTATADIIVDGSAFYVPGKIVTGEYFCITVDSEKIESLGDALKMHILEAVGDSTFHEGGPVYFVVVVNPDNSNYVYVYDLEDVECYVANFCDDQFTFARAIFGPKLLDELKEVLQ